MIRQDKIKRIEAKVKLGLPLSVEEKAYYTLHSKVLDMDVLNAAVKG